MTHEQRAKWIGRIFLLVLTAAILLGAWFYQKQAPGEAVLADPDHVYDLELVFHHEPGKPESDSLASSMGEIARKYERVVRVTTVDMGAIPAAADLAGAPDAPHVSMITEAGEQFAFQGYWPQENIERKIDEILRGLKRVGSDWMPQVPGMQSAAMPNPGTGQ